jgi:hypothetical protein
MVCRQYESNVDREVLAEVKLRFARDSGPICIFIG